MLKNNVLLLVKRTWETCINSCTVKSIGVFTHDDPVILKTNRDGIFREEFMKCLKIKSSFEIEVFTEIPGIQFIQMLTGKMQLLRHFYCIIRYCSTGRKNDDGRIFFILIDESIRNVNLTRGNKPGICIP